MYNFKDIPEAIECAQTLANERDSKVYLVQHEDTLQVYLDRPAHNIAMTVRPE